MRQKAIERIKMSIIKLSLPVTLQVLHSISFIQYLQYCNSTVKSFIKIQLFRACKNGLLLSKAATRGDL